MSKHTVSFTFSEKVFELVKKEALVLERGNKSALVEKILINYFKSKGLLK